MPKTVPKAIGMRTGAVAMLDALGFRGIWSRCDWKHLISALLSIKQAALADGESLSNGLKIPFDLDMRFFSDTIFIAASVPEPIIDLSRAESTAILSEFALAAVSSMAQLSVFRALAIPVAYRGCITVGEFEVAENFVIGPAVDAVAQWERDADGAFVWFLPEALHCFDSALQIHKEHGGVVSNISQLTTVYDVPLKKSVIETRVINPLVNVCRGDNNALNGTVSRLLSSFDVEGADVVRKRENTELFLGHCIDMCKQ